MAQPGLTQHAQLGLSCQPREDAANGMANKRYVSALIFGAGIAILTVFWVLLSILREQTTLRQTQENHTQTDLIIRSIYLDLGYGGFIHHYKNAVLRPAENYYPRAQLAYSAFLNHIEALEQLIDPALQDSHVRPLRQTIASYVEKFEQIDDPTKLTPNQIDALVHTDDTEAIAAINQIELNAHRHFVAKEQASEASLTRLKRQLLLILLVIIFSICGLSFYMLRSARDRVATTSAQQKLTLINTFAGYFAHEFKAPLTQQSSMLSILQAESQLSNDNQRILQRIQHSNQRLQGLMGSLLHYTRLASKTLRPQRFELKPLVDEIATELLAQRSFELRWHAENSTASVFADRLMLRDALSALIDNAIKSTPTGTQPIIDVGHETHKHHEVIKIIDNGPGFGKLDPELMMTPLKRGVSSDIYEGAGIGLSIARLCCDSHHGTLQLSDTERGSGCVTMSLKKSW